MSELAAAVAKVQAALPRIARGETAEVQTKTGGTFKYSYANLAAITEVVRPLLTEHGLVWTCHPDGGGLVWHLIHAESGEEWRGEWALPTAPPQQIGSAITYARRYCLCAVLDITPEGDDDDAQAAQDASSAPQRTRARIPGPDHERLREGTARGAVEGTERVTGETDSPWEAPRKASKNTLNYLQGIFTEMGIKDRDVRLDMASEELGRPVASFSDLTQQEANKLIRARAQRRPADD